MVQREIELVLARQLASCLAQPIILSDRNGDLLFFNEPAEALVGKRFDETGEIRRGEWTALFLPSDDDGAVIKREELPITIALDKREPAHMRFWIKGLDGARRQIESTAFPIVGQAGRLLGAMTIFWEIESP